MDSEDEGARLEAKLDATTTRDQMIRAGLRAGMTALDVGCGSGAGTRVMAEITGSGKATGADSSSDRIAQAKLNASSSGVSYEVGSAGNLPFENASFDFTWSRFLFEYLAEPNAALAEMMRVTKPGGIVAVADLDHQLQTFWPMSEAMVADTDAALLLLRSHSFDPHVGRRLFGWFKVAGMSDVQVRMEFHQVYAGAMPETHLRNWQQKLRTSTAKLIAIDGDSQRWQRLANDLLRLFQRDDFFYYAPLVIVSGVAPSPPL